MNISTKKFSSLFFLLIVLFFTTSCTKKDTPLWETDYNVAVETAKETNKNILLVFTGLSWDKKSSLLKSTILDTEEFMNEAFKDFVLLSIDIDNKNEEIPVEVAQKNYNLAMKLGIPSIPSMEILGNSTLPFTHIDLNDDATTESLLENIAEKEDDIKSFLELEKKMNSAKGIEKVRAIHELCIAAGERSQFFLEEEIRTIPQLDPKNETKLLGQYLSKIAISDANKNMMNNDFDAAIENLVSVAEKKEILTAEEQQQLYYAAAYMAESVKKESSYVVSFLQKAYDVNPTSEGASQLAELIEQIKSQN